MTTMSNITVKDINNVDVTYVALQRAAGDGSFAVWSDTLNEVPIFRPTFKLSSKSNGPGTARRVSIDYRVPQLLQQPDNSFVVRDTLIFTVSGIVPTRVAEDELEKAVALFTNLLKNSQVTDSLTTGQTPI
ncbi:coat protein [ssRNA phage SRR6960509_12]|uniref:Coat protein n=1 Tax=ssRNA phage SRR6960509_12 TaxID=2786523 RepID=A0A8S5L4G7_9VIRU|nr:coat protein [ssRNA phage SRR6960509_12]DAD52584.1 TPA_asm: coat protein [ssRNA phage SRR6960509_12]